MRFPKVTLLKMLCLLFLTFWLLLASNDLWPTWKPIDFLNQVWSIHMVPMRHPSRSYPSVIRYHVYEVFTIVIWWPYATADLYQNNGVLVLWYGGVSAVWDSSMFHFLKYSLSSFQGFTFHLWWPYITSDLYRKQKCSSLIETNLYTL